MLMQVSLTPCGGEQTNFLSVCFIYSVTVVAACSFGNRQLGSTTCCYSFLTIPSLAPNTVSVRDMFNAASNYWNHALFSADV